MIRIDRYKNDTEKIYSECVRRKLSPKAQQQIIASCKKFMPPDFFSQNAHFEELVLAPYEKIKRAYEYIEKSNMETECFWKNSKGKKARKDLYNKLYNSYDDISQELVDGKIKMNVFLVQQTGLTVCPYCNRNYINCRSKKLTGAQLDHFYSRSVYPIFSVCLYNLVPVCATCNRIKHDNVSRFVSPFDETIDWENVIRFSYELIDMSRKKIIIHTNGPIKHNIEKMHIEEAYQIHDLEVNELLDKVNMYSETQREEFENVLGLASLTKQEMKRMVFGPEITEESMKKKPLGRMLRDLQRELGIY